MSTNSENQKSTTRIAKRTRVISPYEFSYKLIVPQEWSGIALIDFYSKRFAYKSREYWKNLILSGNVKLNGEQPTPDVVLNLGDVLITLRPDVEEPAVNDDFQILCDQDGFFVVNKPSPLPVHPSGRYFKNTLLHVLREQYPENKFHTIHRLDNWTTGVQVLATDSTLASCLHTQVEKRSFKKSYAVLAFGDFGAEPFTVDEAIGRIQGPFRGVGALAQNAKASVTHFVPLLKTQNEDGQTMTLLQAIPVTGRTNQIRVHVHAAGGWIVNDPLYSPNSKSDLANISPEVIRYLDSEIDGEFRQQGIDESLIDFMGLHCREMAFRDLLGQWRNFVAPWPSAYLQYFKPGELESVWPAIQL